VWESERASDGSGRTVGDRGGDFDGEEHSEADQKAKDALEGSVLALHSHAFDVPKPPGSR
jgi:hypothetical protein